MELVRSIREAGLKPFRILSEARRKGRVRAIARRRAIARKLSARRGPVVMTTTEARNQFGSMLRNVSRHGTVILRKRDLNEAVVMSYEAYTALTRSKSVQIDPLTARFDALFDRMQQPAARAGLREAFAATPEMLGASAVAAARQLTG